MEEVNGQMRRRRKEKRGADRHNDNKSHPQRPVNRNELRCGGEMEKGRPGEDEDGRAEGEGGNGLKRG